MDNTRDLRDFDAHQLRRAGKLLSCIGTEADQTEVLGPHVTAEFNRDSGAIFLIDAQFNVAMLDGNILKDWFRCPHCQHEGFERSMQGKECCKNHVNKELARRSGEKSISKSRNAS